MLATKNHKNITYLKTWEYSKGTHIEILNQKGKNIYVSKFIRYTTFLQKNFSVNENVELDNLLKNSPIPT